MLDDTLGPALVATLGPGQFAPTTDLHVQFMRPARPGRLTGRGRVVRRGKAVAFMAGELLDDSGELVATATATAQIRAIGSLRGASERSHGRVEQADRAVAQATRERYIGASAANIRPRAVISRLSARRRGRRRSAPGAEWWG
jgi:hypothetical protein